MPAQAATCVRAHHRTLSRMLREVPLRPLELDFRTTATGHGVVNDGALLVRERQAVDGHGAGGDGASAQGAAEAPQRLQLHL